MIIQPITITKLSLTAFTIGVVFLIMSIFVITQVGSNNQLRMYKTLHAKSLMTNKKTEEVSNEKALYLNGSKNEINEFMIDDFKKIYRVNA